MLREEYRAFADLIKSPYLNTEYLGITQSDPDNPSLGNKLVRQAINYGFDREKMVEFLRNGIGVPANSGMIPVGLPAFDAQAVPGYNYNPGKAKQLLQEARIPEWRRYRRNRAKYQQWI